MKKILLVTCLFIGSISMQAQQWQPLVNGSDALYVAYTPVLATDPAGNLYASGSISPYWCIAKWDGSSWSELAGTGIGDSLHAAGPINAIVSDSKGNIYVAGGFQDDSGYYYVAKWDGITWSEVGAGKDTLKANAPIHALAIDTRGNLYAGGEFSDTDYNSNYYENYYVAKWDGTKWTTLGTTTYANNGSGQSCGYQYITAITTDNKGNVYTTYESMVVEWDGADSTWNVLGGDTAGPNGLNNLNGQINTLAADSSGNLYAAGCFNYTVGSGYGAPTYYPVMKWNGVTWSKVDSSGGTDAFGYSSGAVNSLIADKAGNIYAAGNYEVGYINSNSEIVIYSYVAEWISSSSTWIPLAAAPTGDSLAAFSTVSAMARDNSGNLYISSNTYFNNPSGNYIEEWTSSTIATGVTNATSSSPVSVNVYPNPTTSSFTINAPEGGLVTVYSSLGQTVATQNVPAGNTTISLDNTTTGVYTVILTGQTSSYPAVKLVKN